MKTHIDSIEDNMKHLKRETKINWSHLPVPNIMKLVKLLTAKMSTRKFS